MKDRIPFFRMTSIIFIVIVLVIAILAILVNTTGLK